jgi:hypothetical protein
MYYGMGAYITERGPRRGTGEYFQSRPPPLRGLGRSVWLNDAVLPRYAPVGAEGDQYRTMTTGHVALAGAGGLLLGLFMMWAWHATHS